MINLEKNIQNTESKDNTNESVESLPESNLEELSSKTEIEINNSADLLKNKNLDLLEDPESKNFPETKKLLELNEEINKLQNEAIDSISWIKNIKRFNLDKSIKESFYDIEIQGSEEFREKIKNSLSYLSLDPDKLDFSKKYIKRIQEWSHSGMNMFKDKPTFEIGDIWQESDEVYLASGIAHDAYHSYLCAGSQDSNGNISQEAYIGKEAEKKCLAFQIDTLESIKKTDHMKDYQNEIDGDINGLKELMINPTYQDIPYEERTW